MTHRPLPLAATLLLAIAALLGGCSGVTLDHHVGARVPDTSRVDLTGVWQVGERAAYVVQRDRGVVAIAMPEWTGSSFELQQVEYLITQEEDVFYLHSVETHRETGAKRYAPLRLVLRDGGDTLVLMPAKVTHFAEAVESGALPGTVDRGGRSIRGVHLTAEPDVIDEHVDPDRAAEQFNLATLIIAKRIGTLDPEER